MPDKNFRKQLALRIGVLIFSTLVVGGAIFWLSSQIKNEVANIILNRALLNRSAQTSEVLAKLKKDAPTAAGLNRAMAALLPEQEDLLNLPRWVDGVARAHEVSVKTTFQGEQVQPSATAAGYYGFSLDIVGDADRIISFMRDVEIQSPRYLVRFDGFELTRLGETWRVVSHGQIYYRKSPETTDKKQ